MKDECNGKPPLEFVGLRCKMYNLLTYDKKLSKRTAKGVKNRYLAKNVMHDAYLRTLRKKTIKHAKYRFVRARTGSRPWNAVKLRCEPMTTNVTYWKTMSRLWRTVTWS
jgi:hypothetical protein